MSIWLVRACALVLTVFVFSAAGTNAQAGRKVPKVSSPPPAPTATPEPVTRSTPPPKPDFTLKVIADIQPNAFYAFPMPERMQAWVVERLRKSSLLDVRDGGKANRRDAINQARSEAEAYVVLLQLEDDDFGRQDIAGRVRAGQVWINVSVLSPVTGKTKHSRKIVLNEELRTSTLPKVIRPCLAGVYGNDVYLLEASLKAAEYVMQAFSVPVPPGC